MVSIAVSKPLWAPMELIRAEVGTGSVAATIGLVSQNACREPKIHPRKSHSFVAEPGFSGPSRRSMMDFSGLSFFDIVCVVRGVEVLEYRRPHAAIVSTSYWPSRCQCCDPWSIHNPVLRINRG